MTSNKLLSLKVLLTALWFGAFLLLAPIASAQEFVPLTQLPGLEFTNSSDTLPQFLNQLYRILIGVAAVLAVLMIMRAGAEIMISQGSVMNNEKAKDRIKNAILGLVLVLSPVIVFGVINPDILKLEFDFSKLQPSSESGTSNSSTTPSGSGDTKYLLAYSYTQTLKGSSGTSCKYYQPLAYYPSETLCTEKLTKIQEFVAAGADNYTYSDLTILKSCTATTNTSYKYPDDPKACK